MIRDESLQRKFMVLLGGDFSVLIGLLKDPDPKIRRNAALILGQTENEDVLAPVMEAWRTEKTLFVREDYLKAVEHLDYRPYMPQLRARLIEIEAGEGQADNRNQNSPEHSLWDNDKHLAGEASQIRRMIERAGEKKRHIYAKPDPAPELLLVCNVFVRDGSLEELMQVRTWSEMLFPIPGARPIPAQEREAAECLHEMKVYGYLKYLHGGEEGPYRYRVELKGKRELMERKGSFIRGVASRLDMLEKGRIQNNDTDYEVELRLIERSDGTLAPMLKLFTLKDRRFAYRKVSTAQSMAPVNAALVLRLAQSYLREGAQVLDPFCGTGTLLIERELILPSGTCYGIDTFGEAIEKARVNTGTIGHINYINRNFFDFTHAYAFDELITELPQEGSRVEADAGGVSFEERFLHKAAELLAEDAIVVVVTRSSKAMEEAAREVRQEGQDYRLLQKYLLNERLGTTELIFRYRRT